MKKFMFLFVTGAIALTACKEAFKKGDEGMQYRIISDGKGNTLKAGEFAEVHFENLISGSGRKDSLLTSSREQGAPQVVKIDSMGLGPTFYKLMLQLRAGDSLVTKTLVDSVFKRDMTQMPPFMKKGQYVYTNLKIVRVFKTEAEANTARDANMKIAEAAAKAKGEALKVADAKTIDEYVKANKLTGTKTANGVFVQTTVPGGEQLDSNKLVKINYTGTLLNGKKFDSNLDTTNGRKIEPLLVNLTNDYQLGGGVIQGMSEALKVMQVGSKGKMIIPSGLAYGPQPPSPEIPKDAILVFDVEILSALSKAQAKAENEVKQKQYMEEQKKAQAEMEKAQKAAADTMKKK
jgi:FKBP-type peptidyl-prolyl cis-trans isomerase FkpA